MDLATVHFILCPDWLAPAYPSNLLVLTGGQEQAISAWILREVAVTCEKLRSCEVENTGLPF
jgi:hypothetical protein